MNAIAGYVHADVRVQGRGDHAGATPMGMRLDPTTVLAETVLELERLATEAGAGTVGTVGEIEVDPGLINAVAADAAVLARRARARRRALPVASRPPRRRSRWARRNGAA